MAFCTSCGSRLDDSDRHCATCGAARKLVEAPAVSVENDFVSLGIRESDIIISRPGAGVAVRVPEKIRRHGGGKLLTPFRVHAKAMAILKKGHPGIPEAIFLQLHKTNLSRCVCLSRRREPDRR
jgi:hypothetical protein